MHFDIGLYRASNYKNHSFGGDTQKSLCYDGLAKEQHKLKHQKLLSSGCETRPAEWALGARQHTLQSSHCEARPTEWARRGERSQWSHLRLPEDLSDPGGLLLVQKRRFSGQRCSKGGVIATSSDGQVTISNDQVTANRGQLVDKPFGQGRL